MLDTRSAMVCVGVGALIAAAAVADTGRELRVAARNGDVGAVKRLLEAGVAVDAADDWGTTPLVLAVKQNQLDVVRHLLDYVSRHGYRLFGWWRLIVGTAGLIWLLAVPT